MGTRGRPRIFTDEERKERMRDSQARWCAAHVEYKRELSRKYKQRDDVKQHIREYHAANADRINARRRKRYRELHPLPGEVSSDSTDTTSSEPSTVEQNAP